jgi:xanthine dehydrogenase iron-sulfur cluster and FAD-binding subunit A
VRLLPERHDHGRRRAAEGQAAPTDADIDATMTNICRCGTYNRVRAAIKVASGQQKVAGADIVHVVRSQA